MELIVVAHFLVIRDQSFLATGGGVGRGEGWGGMEGRQRTLVVSQ